MSKKMQLAEWQAILGNEVGDEVRSRSVGKDSVFGSWTNREVELAAKLYKTMSASRVAKQLGRSKASVQSKLRGSKVAVRKQGWRSWTPEEEAALLSTSNDTEAGKLLSRSIASCKSKRFELNRVICVAGVVV
jgi:hypothetical protein